MNKLCIGTVQFGLKYGVNNQSGVPNYEIIEQILNFAYDKNISFLDTANVYGDAQLKIGKLHHNRFKIVGKFPILNSSANLKSEFQKTLLQLNTNSIYGYIAHDANNLISKPELWVTLKELKTNKQIKKIGYSLYYPEQLNELLSLNLIPDLVQLPFSLLDRKFEQYFEQLKKLGTEIHVRSVFLQGLYFINPLNLPNKLKCLKSELIQLHNICKEYQIDINTLALNYTNSNSYIDKVVIGIDNISQLEKNWQSLNKIKFNPDLISAVNKIEVRQEKLLNPANW